MLDRLIHPFLQSWGHLAIPWTPCRLWLHFLPLHFHDWIRKNVIIRFKNSAVFVFDIIKLATKSWFLFHVCIVDMKKGKKPIRVAVKRHGFYVLFSKSIFFCLLCTYFHKHVMKTTIALTIHSQDSTQRAPSLMICL